MNKIQKEIENFQNKTFDDSEVFRTSLWHIFASMMDKLKEMRYDVAEALECERTKDLYLSTLNQISELQKMAFKFSTSFHDTARFNIAFSYYRIFLDEYFLMQKFMDKVIAKSYTGELHEVSLSLTYLRNKLTPITNNNAESHLKIREQNQPINDKIKELEEKRIALLKVAIK